MNQLIKSILLTVCLSLGSTLANAADESLKIGVLDWQQLLSKAPQAEEAGKRLEKEFQDPKDKLINKQKEFQTKRDKMQRDKDVMSASERAKKEKELVKTEQELRRLDEELRGDYTTRHREEMDEFIKTVRETVDKLARDQKYDLIISHESAVYVADRVDITETVLGKLKTLAKNSDKKDSKSGKKSD